MADPKILRREVELLFRNLLLGQIVSFFNSGLLCWIDANSARPHGSLAWIWLAIAWLIAAIRIVHYHQYRSNPERMSPRRWRRLAIVGALAAGLAWGGGALLFTYNAATEQQLFTAFVMAGMVAGAVPILAADRNAFRVYAWPLVFSVFIGLLGSDAIHVSASIMALLFLAAALQGARYFHATLHETLRLESEKDALVADLQAAKQVAERSDRAKSEFLSNISHELRTPLNGVLGMADLLSLEDLSPTQRELLDPLKQSGNQLLGLINNMIELSAIEAGHVQLKPTPFLLNDVMEDGLTRFASNARNKGLEWKQISTWPENTQTLLVGDVTRLRQILEHLVDNAIRFTEHGHVKISTSLISHDKRQALVTFSVSDTGVGIPLEKLETITHTFSQADGSSTRRHGGVGIGLPIARRLVELMGGRLHIESQPGVGSTFSFTLPFALDSEDH